MFKASAFLATTGKGASMRGLRAAEAEMGVVAQGAERGIGMKFVRDSSAEGGLRRITKEQYGQIMDDGDFKSIVNNNPVADAEKGSNEKINLFLIINNLYLLNRFFKVIFMIKL